jgi:hypothetical protein
MDQERYRRFSDDLRRALAADPRVLGMVALGSMAEAGRSPDRWSDHDFFIITRPGEQKAFRESQAWLPDAGNIVLSFRDTAHGCKALYESGHLVEYAVFDPDEIAVARVNAYRVLFDRERVAERIRAVADVSAAANRPNASFLAGRFLTDLVVACGRDHRGETASARERLASAVRNLAELIAARVSAVGAASLDNLDPLRRFEVVYPEAGESIEAAMRLPVRPAAEALLELFVRTVATSDELRAVDATRALTQ